MARKVHPEKHSPTTSTSAASSTVTTVPTIASVDEVSHQMMQWIGLSMRLSSGRPMSESLEMLNELGLTMPQVVALHVMAFEGELTMTGLVDRIGLSTSAVSHLLHRLVQAGLCERKDDPDDRRQKRVGLTPAGFDVVRRLLRSRVSDMRSAVEPLSDNTRARLNELLQAIVAELTQQVPTTSAGAGANCHYAGNKHDDVWQRLAVIGDDLEGIGDDIADTAAHLGDRIARSAADLGDRIATHAAGISEGVAKTAVERSEQLINKVKARVAPKKQQEK